MFVFQLDLSITLPRLGYGKLIGQNLNLTHKGNTDHFIVFTLIMM